jgi:CubicO group peptidase (beta-lactamase class C family)
MRRYITNRSLQRCVAAVRGFALLLMCAAAAATDASKANVPKETSVDALFAEWHRPGQPGLAVGIYQRGKQVYANGYGYADLENNIPISPRTVFHIASVSKQFVAFSAVLLQRDGILNLEEDIRAHLPYVPDFGHRITPRHLIYHTSGLRDQWSLFTLGGRDMDDRLRQSQVVNMVKRQRALNFSPGSDFSYSNTGYTLLSELVAAVSGQSFREFTDTRIFRPLGMYQTLFFVDVTEIVPNRAHSYKKEKGKWHRSLLNFDNVGATGLHTTVGDLLRWAGNFTQPVVGDAALIREFTQMGRLDDGTPINYGSALTNETFVGRKALRHSGSDAGFRSLFAYFPEEDFAVALLANTPMDLVAPMEQITALYLNAGRVPSSETIPASLTPDRSLLKAIQGHYMQPHSMTMIFEDSSAGVVMKNFGSEPRSVIFRVDGTFDFGNAQRRSGDFYKPIYDNRGRITAIGEGRPNVVNGRVSQYQRIEPVTPSDTDLQRLTGAYRSTELDITYDVTLAYGELLISSIWLPKPIKLTPTTADRYEGELPIGILTVERDADRNPIALLASTGRVRDLRLHKLP